MSALLSVEELSVYYPMPRTLSDLVMRRPKRGIRAVAGVNLDLKRGETLGLVGESGCGKSTMGRAILRLVRPTEGSVRFDGHDVATLKGADLLAFRGRAQMVFQDPHASLNPVLTVGGTLAEALRFHGCPAARTDGRINQLLETVGLSADLRGRRPATLSGGQCQRVGIARALAAEPELIISDESVSALDVSIQAQIINLFLRLKQTMNLTMIFISHDLGVVRHLCHTIAVMYLGRIVEYGPTEHIFANPRHPYTRTLMDAIPRTDPDATLPLGEHLDEPPSPIDSPPGCAFHPRCSHASEACRTGSAPALRRVGDVCVGCNLF